MKRMFKALTAAACTLSMTGSAVIYAKEDNTGKEQTTEEKTLTVVYVYPEGVQGTEPEVMKYEPQQPEDAQEGETYIATRDLQTFVMEHQPEKGYEVSLKKIWFDQDLTNGFDLAVDAKDFSVKDTDTIYLKADKDDGAYDIVFYSAPGEVLQARTVKAGVVIEQPETDPEEEGKTFEGWGLKKDQKAEENLYLYPEWKEDTKAEESKDPSTAYDGNNSEKAESADSGDKTVTNVQLTFDPENGQDPQILTLEKGSVIDQKELYTPAKTGYEFKGWNPAVPETADRSETFTAVYEKTPAEYTVTWVADGKTVREDKVEEGSATPAAPEVKAPEGYEFKGWNQEPAETVTGNVTYTAVFEKTEPETEMITVSFAGTDQELKSLTFPKGTPFKDVEDKLPTPVREGYTFKGWSGAPEVLDQDVTLTAEFEQNTYTVTYMNGDAVISQETAKYGEKTPVINDPAREGYTFEGWSPAVAETVTGDAEYKAVWKLVPAEDLKITIQYLEEGTNKQLHYSNVVEVVKGSTYDISRFDKIEIKGYTYVKTDGSLTGTADKDETVTVWYTPEKKAAAGTQGTDTSTDTSAALYLGIGAAAVVAIIVLLVLRKKK